MSSCESYVKHRWTIELDSDDMDTLREMLEFARGVHPQSDAMHDRFEALQNLIECVG